MKINKSDPAHWLYLIIFTANTCMALLFRLICKPSHKDTVILYGHKLNGNLKSLYDYAEKTSPGNTLFFLTMDPAYYQILKQQDKQVLCGLYPLHMLKLASAHALVCDHGLHSLILFLKFSNMKFIDVWHGLPFKGFDKHDFTPQRQFDEVWVTSTLIKQLYINQFGFPPDIIKITGYARTDLLINQNSDANKIKTSVGIPDNSRKIILFAPTWQQDQENRNIFPFGISETDFLQAMDSFCEQHHALCLLRKHLNSPTSGIDNYKHIYNASSQQFPDTEEILLISDILICDWSSIAFDYLLLNRPTLFLDVEPPFKKGFSLDRGYRFGQVVTSMEAMLEYLGIFIANPDIYAEKYSGKHETVKNALYEGNADGHVSERCFKRLANL
jgi:CDP-glycerol glycerophosphotransferase (TagB/SpsB family)